MTMLVVVSPGQGAQTPGFLAPWLEVEGVRPLLEWLSAAADVDLVTHGTTCDAETIRDTAVAQPLLVASGLVAWQALDTPRGLGAAAGHSVGEITAAVTAGVLTPEQAMVLVRERGRAMAQAAALAETGMTALLGGDHDEVLATLEQHGLTPANVNGAGQVVAAGTTEQLAALAQAPPARARLRPLSVAGAFHTEYMAPAVDRLAALAGGLQARDPQVALLSNRDGGVVTSRTEVLDRLVAQVSSPVRWDLCMQTMADLGVTGMLELAPAGTLTGLARRGLPGVATFALSTPDQLDDARAFIADHSKSTTPAHTAPAWRLVVAPIKGTVSTAAHAVGSLLAPGTIVGHVRSLRDAWDVVAPHGGRIVEWLVEDGDPVSPGQPLVRLHPESDDDATEGAA
jgi:[acyl-carrier-protein] S-malonyltransferase